MKDADAMILHIRTGEFGYTILTPFLNGIFGAQKSFDFPF